MRSLVDLYDQRGEPRRFAEEFVRLHDGWPSAIGHWERTVRLFLDQDKEIADLSMRRRMESAEDNSMKILWSVIQDGRRCPWCRYDRA
jgi:hypothetical protein